MNTFSKIILAAALLGAATTISAQTTIGYSNGTSVRGNGVRFSTNKTQGAAIRIAKEKAENLKGCTISNIEMALSTSHVENLTIFISKDLNGEPEYKQTGIKGSTRWKKYALSTPYTITGEEFYIGYTCDVTENYSPLSFDESLNFNEPLIWALNDGKWENISNKGYGAANVRAILNENKPLTDIITKPVHTEGYFKIGEEYTFNGQIYNFGSTPVKSFDLTYQIEDSKPSTIHIENQEIPSNSTFDFTLPKYTPTTSGKVSIKLTVNNINGTDDADNSDNMSQAQPYFYPADIKRMCLVESFTGQGCGNCPSGHETLKKALSGNEGNTIEVSHHSGYQLDAFSMKEDIAYTWFYNSPNTFAPGATFNRTPIFEGASSVILEAQNLKDLKEAISLFDKSQPYVSIDLANNYNAGTRTCNLSTKIFTHVLPDEGQYNLNVWVIQDSIVASQAGAGSNYIHNHVFRGSLNGIWGETIKLVEGETIEKNYTYTLPQAIVSTSSNPANIPIPTDLKNMHFVVFVSKADKSPLNCKVLNANSIKMDSNISTGIESTQANEEALISVCGNQITIQGNYASATIFNILGQKIQQLNATASCTLPKGMYIVSVAQKNGMVSTKNIYISK